MLEFASDSILADEEKRSKQDPVAGMTILDMPDKLMLPIARYLPSYSFVGSNPISAVCKKWNTLFANDKVIQQKKTVSGLQSSCQSPMDALYILSDDSLINHIGLAHSGLDDILLIIAKNPTLVLHIFQNQELRGLLLNHELITLSKEHLETSQYVVDHAVALKMSHDNLIALGERHLAIAKKLFLQPKIRENKEYLLKLAKHEEIGLEILNTPELYNIIDLDLISRRLNHYSFTFIKNILQHPVLQKKLKPINLEKIGQYHIEFSQYILESQEMMKKIEKCFLKSSRLVTLLQHFQPLVEKIQQNPALLDKISKEGLMDLGEKHLDFAQYLLETELLAKRLKVNDFAKLGHYHPSLALGILKTWREKLNGKQLVKICEFKVDCLEYVINDPQLLAKLEGEDLAELGWWCLDAAQYILNTPQLQQKLSADNLVKLSQGFPQVALQILQSETSCQRLESEHLLILSDLHRTSKQYLESSGLDKKVRAEDVYGGSHTSFMNPMVSDPELSTTLTGETLASFGEDSLSSALTILKTKALYDRLDPTELRRVGCAFFPAAQCILQTKDLQSRLTPEDLDRVKKVAQFISGVQSIAKHQLAESKANVTLKRGHESIDKPKEQDDIAKPKNAIKLKKQRHLGSRHF